MRWILVTALLVGACTGAADTADTDDADTGAPDDTDTGSNDTDTGPDDTDTGPDDTDTGPDDTDTGPDDTDTGPDDTDTGTDDTDDTGTEPLACTNDPNAAPILSDLETTPLLYTEPAFVSDSITVSDADDAILVGATVSVGDGWQEDLDQLTLSTRPADIDWSWDSRSGVLTITGEASKGTYQVALQKIEFSTDMEGDGWSGTDRVITFQVSDPCDASVAVTRTITFNDAM